MHLMFSRTTELTKITFQECNTPHYVLFSVMRQINLFNN